MNLTRKTIAAFPLLAAALAATPVLAHHSFAMFDKTKERSVTGTVKLYSWTNPHIRIELIEPNGKPGSEVWNIEGPTPNALLPAGWKRTTLKPGDRVTIKLNPMRNGESAGLLVSATLADGRVLADGVKP